MSTRLFGSIWCAVTKTGGKGAPAVNPCVAWYCAANGCTTANSRSESDSLRRYEETARILTGKNGATVPINPTAKSTIVISHQKSSMGFVNRDP